MLIAQLKFPLITKRKASVDGLEGSITLEVSFPKVFRKSKERPTKANIADPADYNTHPPG